MPKSYKADLSFVVLATFLHIKSTITLTNLDKTAFNTKPIAYITVDKPITVIKYITGLFRIQLFENRPSRILSFKNRMHMI